MNFFRSHAAQKSNTQVWFQLSDLPWAPTYSFNEARTAVTLDTAANDEWWPKVLTLTGSKAWRMPFSDRIRSIPHNFATNATWAFDLPGGAKKNVPMFASGVASRGR
jgi:hypothetical protein